MVLILFFILFSFLNTEETEAMKAMDKKLFKAQLERDLRNLENISFKNKEPDTEKLNKKVKDFREVIRNESPSLKEHTKASPKVKFKNNQREYNKFLNEIIKMHKLRITNKGNIIIGKKIRNINLIDKLYGNEEFIYYPLKNTKYISNKNFNFYFVKKLGLYLKIFDSNNLVIKEREGEIFDIFVEDFQEEIY